MKKTLVLAVPALVAVVVMFGVVDRAEASHSWENYHWARTANPLTLKLGDNLSSTWKTYLSTASADWTLSSVLNTNIVSGLGGKNCKASAGRVEVCNRTYGKNGWLGLAQIWISGGHITQGVVKLNDTYFNTAKYNNPNEKLHVMCQEVGHTFGLDHQSEDGSSQDTCMDYFSNTGANALSTVSTHPNQHDYDQLVTIYSHLDSIDTASLSSVGQNMDLNDPKAWGRVVREDATGRTSLYERDLGGGKKFFTFVTWAQ